MSDVDDGPQHPYVAQFARDGRLELTFSPVKSIAVATFGGVLGAVILWANVGRFAGALAGRTSGGALAGVLFVGAIVLFLLGGAVVSIVGTLAPPSGPAHPRGRRSLRRRERRVSAFA